MQVMVNVNRAYITMPEGLGTDIFSSTNAVIKRIANVRYGSVNIKVEDKHFPGALTYERKPGENIKDSYSLYYADKNGEVVRLCVYGLNKVFGKIPRRIYVKVV